MGVTPKKCEKKCLNCKWFVFTAATLTSTRVWGDCAHSGVPFPLKKNQHKDNGTNCPGFASRDEETNYYTGLEYKP